MKLLPNVRRANSVGKLREGFGPLSLFRGTMTPVEFRTELVGYITEIEFQPFNTLLPWQLDIVDRMMKDYAICTGQSAAVNLDILKGCSTPDKKSWGCKAKQKEENPMASYASAQIIADTTEKDQR